MENLYNSRNPAVKRIFKEAQELAENPDEDFHAGPLQDNLFEWHFTIRGPVETPFENGLYHGFMPTPGSGAIGALDLPDAQRKQFAQLSKTWTCPDCRLANCDLLPSAAVNGDSSNADAKTPTNITEDGRPAEPYRFPTAATKESVGETPSSPASIESASGDSIAEDSFNRPLPPRPRTSSLQSRPGRGSGKRARFADDPVTPTDFPSSAPTFSKAIVKDSLPIADSLDGPGASFATPSAPVAVSTTNSGPLQELPRSENSLIEMRQRQALILQQRQKVLRDRLATTERLPVPNPAPNAGAFGVTDPLRLERIIQNLRQIVLLITVCLMIIVLRRVILVLEDEEYGEL